MSNPIGGRSADAALEDLAGHPLAQAESLGRIEPIAAAEHVERLERVTRVMEREGVDALYLHGGSNLLYFTGTAWHPSERMVAGLVTGGQLDYVAPAFERETLASHTLVEAELHCWEEHESPYALLGDVLAGRGVPRGRLAVDPQAPFFVVEGMRAANPGLELVSAAPVAGPLRAAKSPAELALMQAAKDRTLVVQQATAGILREGITSAEVEGFIDRAHRVMGASGSSFCIVLFGPDSAIPHGVREPKALERDDVVLIDTGCVLHGYQSDITRTYVFGEPSARQREVWTAEKNAQAAAFAAAEVGAPCSAVDAAARRSLEAGGFGPGYALPGLPHRTGHGIGLDIHEGPYLVGGDETPLAPGMCFSNEPMICVPGEFGVRLEDHFYMTADGPRWFTQPSPSIDEPF